MVDALNQQCFDDPASCPISVERWENFWFISLPQLIVSFGLMWGNPSQSWVLDSTPWIPDSRYWILDSLSVELGFQIPIVSGIPDSLSCFLDSKAQDSGLHKQIFPDFGFPWLHGAISYLTQRERWRPKHKKRQPEVDIFSLVLWRLTRQTRRAGVKTKHSDSLCKTDAFRQARYRTSGYYSWHLERQLSRC